MNKQEHIINESGNEPIYAPSFRDEVSMSGLWVAIRKRPKSLTWIKMEGALTSNSGHYFSSESHAKWEGLVYAKSQLIKTDCGEFAPAGQTVVDIDGLIQLDSMCYGLSNRDGETGARYCLIEDTYVTDGGYYYAKCDMAYVSAENFTGHAHKDDCITTDSGILVRRSESMILDGIVFGLSEVCQPIMFNGNKIDWCKREDCTFDGLYWRQKCDVVVTKCGSYFREACRKVEGAWIPMNLLTQTVNNGFQLIDDCISVCGSYYLKSDACVVFNDDFGVRSRYVKVWGGEEWHKKVDCTKIDGKDYLISDCVEVGSSLRLKSDCVYLEDTEKYVLSDDDYWHIEQFNIHVSREADGYEWSDTLNEYIDITSDLYTYVDRYGGYILSECVRECSCGEIYDVDRDPRCCHPSKNQAGRINQYHASPKPSFFIQVESKWGIGFEVEKTTIDGLRRAEEEIEQQPLFCGWETDSSCGVEGITHVYDLHEQYNKFSDHVHQSNYVNEPTNNSCGGHVNISRKGGLSLSDIKPYAGLTYALYRDRLSNTYACKNKRLSCESGSRDYSVVKVKSGNLLEFRLVPKVDDQNDLLWRFKYFAIFANAVERQWSYEHYLRMSRPLLQEKYGISTTSQMFGLSRKFKEWLMGSSPHESINKYVSY